MVLAVEAHVILMFHTAGENGQDIVGDIMIVTGAILEEVTSRNGNGNGGRRFLERVKPAAQADDVVTVAALQAIEGASSFGHPIVLLIDWGS